VRAMAFLSALRSSRGRDAGSRFLLLPCDSMGGEIGLLEEEFGDEWVEMVNGIGRGKSDWGVVGGGVRRYFGA